MGTTDNIAVRIHQFGAPHASAHRDDAHMQHPSCPLFEHFFHPEQTDDGFAVGDFS